MLDERGTPDLYRNWDDLEWRRSVSRDPYGFIEAYRPMPEKGTTSPSTSTSFGTRRSARWTS
jgi:hypothetical protein